MTNSTERSVYLQIYLIIAAGGRGCLGTRLRDRILVKLCGQSHEHGKHGCVQYEN